MGRLLVACAEKGDNGSRENDLSGPQDPPAAAPSGTLSEEDQAAFEAMSYPERLEIEAEPLAEALGYDLRDGLFGFTPFSELWTGRLAMAGFVVGLVQETLTGDTILQQVGLNSQCKECLATALVALLVGVTLIAAVSTVYRAQNGSMSVAEWRRYAKFFGMGTEEQAADVAAQQKDRGLAKLLTVPDKQELDRSALTTNENVLWSVLRVVGYFMLKDEVAPTAGAEAQSVKSAAELLRLAEVQMGRLAMLGFVSAVVAEALLGVGIREQLAFYSTLLITGESLDAVTAADFV